MPSSTEVNVEYMTLIVQSSIEVCSSSYNISTKNESENTKKSVEDNLALNKDIDFQICVEPEVYDESDKKSTTLTEEHLIEIEHEWMRLNDMKYGIMKDEQEDWELSESEDECIQPLYPIQNVLNPILVKNILLKSAVASCDFSANPFYTKTNRTPKKGKENNLFSKHSIKEHPESNHSRGERRVPEHHRSRKDNHLVSSVKPTDIQHDAIFPRKQKTRIQSIIKKIEKELENDIGDGYGDAQWCKEFTKNRKELDEIKEPSAEESKTDLTNRLMQTPKTFIPTPSWRVLEDYDCADGIIDNTECDAGIDDVRSVHSDTSYQSESSLDSSTTWVPSDTLKEYIMPVDNLDSDLNVEVRLINLTEIQIQALRKTIMHDSRNLVPKATTPSAAD